MMAKLVKSKIFWFAVAYTCILAVALAFSLSGGQESAHYECTREDIMHNTKISGAFDDIFQQDLKPSDRISIFIHFDQKPTEGQLAQIEQFGVEIQKGWSWTPYPDYSGGFYVGNCAVEDLCRFLEIDFVTRVRSAE
jgi:hypothetical protein